MKKLRITKKLLEDPHFVEAIKAQLTEFTDDRLENRGILRVITLYLKILPSSENYKKYQNKNQTKEH